MLKKLSKGSASAAQVEKPKEDVDENEWVQIELARKAQLQEIQREEAANNNVDNVNNNSNPFGDVEDENEADKPEWVRALHDAWDDEVKTMPTHKQQYFLQFKDYDDNVEDDGAKNRKIIKHMKHFIEDQFAQQQQQQLLAKEKEKLEGAQNVVSRPEEGGAAAQNNLQLAVVLELPTIDDTEVLSDSDDSEDEDGNGEKRRQSKDEQQQQQAPRTSASFIIKNVEAQQQPQALTKKPSLLSRLFSAAKSGPKSPAEVLEDLTKYATKLAKHLDESKLVIKELRTNEKTIHRAMLTEIETLKQYYLHKLIPLFRTLSILRIERLKKRRELEKTCKRTIKLRLKQTQQAVAQIQAAQQANPNAVIIPPTISEDFYKDIDELFLLNPTVSQQWQTIKTMDAKIARLSERYNNVKKHFGKQRTTKENTVLLSNLLNTKMHKYATFIKDPDESDITLSTNLRLYFMDRLEGAEQREFGCIIGDVRTEEGRTIRTFLNELQSYSLQKVPASEIVGYVQSYASYLVKIHKLTSPPNAHQYLHILVERFIFGLIGGDLRKFEAEKAVEQDDSFAEKVSILKKLTIVQLGVDVKFLSPEKLANPNDESIICFEEAIQIIENLPYLNAPGDILHCILCCAKSIHNTAHKFCTMKGHDFAFGADEFFPILVYVVVQATLPGIHAILGFITKYMPDRISSEISYYLTCLEGSVSYVTQVTAEEISNLTKLEAKNK